VTNKFFRQLELDYFTLFHWSTLWGEEPPSERPPEPQGEQAIDAAKAQARIRSVSTLINAVYGSLTLCWFAAVI
jgi:hypothetical protein